MGGDEVFFRIGLLDAFALEPLQDWGLELLVVGGGLGVGEGCAQDVDGVGGGLFLGFFLAFGSRHE